MEVDQGGGSMSKFKLNLPAKVTMLVWFVVIMTLLITNYFMKEYLEKTTIENIEENAINISRTVSKSPIIIDALRGKSDRNVIQSYAEDIRKETNSLFIVVLDMKGIRLSHPLVEKIGQRFVGGDEEPVLEGRENVSIAEGTLGHSLRAFTPVFDSNGTQVGAVVVGILLDEVETKVVESHKIIYFTVVIGMIVGMIGAIFLARKVKNIMFGLEPHQIAKLLKERSAMLEHAKEGFLGIDSEGRIIFVNQEAQRLFKLMGIKDKIRGRKVEEVLKQGEITRVIKDGDAALDVAYEMNGVSIVSNVVPIIVEGIVVGAVVTFRDRTEIKWLAEQLTGVRSYADALRAQTHEFMNKLHVINGMVQMEFYDDLTDFVKGITNKYQMEVGFITARFKEPAIAGFILGKISYAREKDVEITISEDCFVPIPANQDSLSDFVTVVGNLVDNAIEAVSGLPNKKIDVNITYDEQELKIHVGDTGKGLSTEEQENLFKKGFSTKGTDRGMGLYLVHQVIKNRGGSIHVSSEKGKGTIFNVILPFESR